MKAPLAECAGCPGEGRTFVSPEPARARIRLAIVGEMPGRNEVERRRPFVGAAGRDMLRHLQGIGVSRGDCHWTNAVLCDVPERDLELARKRCSKRLQAELSAAGAPVVVPVGAIAAKSTLGRTGSTPIMKWRGSVSSITYGEHPSGEKGTVVAAAKPVRPQDPQDASPVEAVRAASAWVLPTIHPSFVMRAPQWAPIIATDMQRVGRVLRQGFTPPEAQGGRITHLLGSLSQADALGLLEELLPKLGEAVADDVETVGLGPTQTNLVCYVLSDGPTTIVVPWSKGRDGRVSWWSDGGTRAAELTTRALASRVTVTHNGPAFDHLVNERYDLRHAQWEDTLLMAHALWPGLKKGLSHVVTACGLDVPPWKEQEDRTATIERLWGYCGRDGLYTILAYWRLRELLHS